MHNERSRTAAAVGALSDLERLVILTLRAQRTAADRRLLALSLIDAGRRRAGLAVVVAPKARRA